MITPGTHKARAVSAAMEKSQSKGTEQVRVTFRVGDDTIDWYGYFGENSEKRTLESLMLCGWDGQDFVTFNGITQNDVNLVCEEEEYEGKKRVRACWVNDPNRTVGGKPMEATEVASFADRMRAKVAALKASKGQSSGMPGTSFDFGANKARI